LSDKVGKKNSFTLTLNVIIFQFVQPKFLNFFPQIPIIVYYKSILLNFEKINIFKFFFLIALKSNNFLQFLLEVCLSSLGVNKFKWNCVIIYKERMPCIHHQWYRYFLGEVSHCNYTNNVRLRFWTPYLFSKKLSKK